MGKLSLLYVVLILLAGCSGSSIATQEVDYVEDADGEIIDTMDPASDEESEDASLVDPDTSVLVDEDGAEFDEAEDVAPDEGGAEDDEGVTPEEDVISDADTDTDVLETPDVSTDVDEDKPDETADEIPDVEEMEDADTDGMPLDENSSPDESMVVDEENPSPDIEIEEPDVDAYLTDFREKCTPGDWKMYPCTEEVREYYKPMYTFFGDILSVEEKYWNGKIREEYLTHRVALFCGGDGSWSMRAPKVPLNNKQICQRAFFGYAADGNLWTLPGRHPVPRLNHWPYETYNRVNSWSEAVEACNKLGGRIPTEEELRFWAIGCPELGVGGECFADHSVYSSSDWQYYTCAPECAPWKSTYPAGSPKNSLFRIYRNEAEYPVPQTAHTGLPFEHGIIGELVGVNSHGFPMYIAAQSNARLLVRDARGTPTDGLGFACILDPDVLAR